MLGISFLLYIIIMSFSSCWKNMSSEKCIRWDLQVYNNISRGVNFSYYCMQIMKKFMQKKKGNVIEYSGVLKWILSLILINTVTQCQLNVNIVGKYLNRCQQKTLIRSIRITQCNGFIDTFHVKKCIGSVGTYRSQSTAIMRVTSSAGSPTALSTITMVTRPACGTPAAPMLAAVAVTLHPKSKRHNNWGGVWPKVYL